MDNNGVWMEDLNKFERVQIYYNKNCEENGAFLLKLECLSSSLCCNECNEGKNETYE